MYTMAVKCKPSCATLTATIFRRRLGVSKSLCHSKTREMVLIYPSVCLFFYVVCICVHILHEFWQCDGEHGYAGNPRYSVSTPAVVRGWSNARKLKVVQDYVPIYSLLYFKPQGYTAVFIVRCMLQYKPECYAGASFCKAENTSDLVDNFHVFIHFTYIERGSGILSGDYVPCC